MDHRSNYTVSSYSGSDTWTQTISDIDTESYEYTATITDSVQTVTTKRQTAIICLSRLRGGKGVTFFGEAQNTGIWVNNSGTYTRLDTNYIVETGGTGIWNWYRYKNGMVVCFGHKSFGVTSWTSFGNAYEGNPGAGAEAYPTVNGSSIFQFAPNLFVNVTRGSGPAFIGYEMSTGWSSTQTPNVYPIRPSSSSPNAAA